MPDEDFRDPEIDRVRAEFPSLVAVGLDMERGLLRYSERNLTNHSLRAILVGLWLRLPREDREDHIRELEHYMLPSSDPPGISRLIAQAGQG